MRGPLHFAVCIALVVLSDQASKWWIVTHFSLYESLPVVPGFLNLTYLTNTGAAFGLLAGQPALWRQVFFVGIALAALGVIFFIYLRLRRDSFFYELSLALIAGGALGNLIDRIRFGAVIDFLDVYVGTYHWPAFNIADSAITVGVTIFLVYSFFFEKKEMSTPRNLNP
ncbi:MAG: signal peptidase II [Desulfobulbaceae bacterium]|nr:signal peptidase II [Desulfobulbaceae bacterium]